MDELNPTRKESAMAKKATEFVGRNNNTHVYQLVFNPQDEKVVQESILGLAMNPSHRWVQYKLVVACNVLYITNRQARWLVEYFESKKVKCALKIISN
jgi:hypothetical protein